MASAGSATAGLRHSFLAPSTTDPDVRATKMARTPSLPAHKTKPSASAKRRSKRSSGLFESSSESGSESSHEPSPADPVRGKKEARRRETAVSNAAAAAPPTRSRHHSLGASPVMVAAMPSRENSVNNERKGLFEIDDDTADSVETLRERVKLRQKKKEHEVQSLKSELEAALARVSELDDVLARERREKDEFAIRMDECQRIIEKRNKQLIKASERLARITEQSESHVSELQQQLEAMKVEVERMKAAERAALERQRSEYEDKLAHERVRWEAQVETVTLAAAEKLCVKDAEEAHLQRRIAQLEADVVGATSRIAESSEYQILLKRCDDAEAISRGLRFQLEKAQHEKKYLKKQLAAATAPTTASASSNAFLPPTDLFADVSSTHTERGNHSPTSSIASADLASFDFSRVEISPPMSPIGASPPKPSLKTAADPEAQRSDDPSQGDTSSKDGRFETLFGGGTNDTGENSDDGPPPATAPSQSESKTRPGSGTINFFEKISIKFKRTASSPRNSAPAPPGGKSVGDETSSQSASPAPAMDLPPTNRRKVLSKRPKMYVAKSPSDYEESSDSIFGSDSDSDESSDEDDDDQPPPPPPKDFGSRSPTGSVETASVGATAPPPPPPPLFGDVSDNDGDSSSDDDVRPPSRSGDLRRVILPTPASPPPPGPKEPIQSQPDHHKTARAKVPSSSGDSDSDLSDSSDDGEKHKKPPSPAKSPTVRVDTTKTKAQAKAVASSSDSEQEVPVRKEETRRRRVSIDDTNVHEASANQPKTKRERSRSTEADANAAAAAKVNRMNEYMEARARKRQEKLSKKEEKEIAEHKKREEYEKEWERMAEEERERRRKQQKARRTGKRRPSSMKTVRVSQMRNHMNKQQKDVQGDGGLGQTKAEDSDEDNGPPQPDAQRRGHQSSGSDASEDESGQQQQQPSMSEASSPPLPPEPTAVNTDLYLRQQARLREHHEMEMKKKQDSAEADQVRGQIHRRVELWAYAKELHHMILTLDQISSNEALRQCQLMVVQSPDPETLRKAYRNIIRVIHPDKVRNATITEQLEAKELFTVLNQAFEKFKAQQQ